MLLLLDSGHSRVAWGLANEHGWVAQGAVRNQDIGTLALREWQNLPRPARVIGVNVAGEATRVRVEAQLLRWRTMPDWLIATEYAVVVTARTAVCVDALDGDGIFRGGVILPGPNLMLQALAANTPNLKMPPGRYHDFPVTNADAMFSGVMQSICGAVEQMRARLATADSPTRCFLSGGAAPDIAPHLTAPVDVVDNLVLEGVLALATQT
ncbi:MAG: type III pantothenate kinase [Betaproteobacteria bacterium]|nr:MAG: type III pantothenate kinase [Betaproteobacteria bacterium]